MIRKYLAFSGILAAAIVISGCAPKSYTVESPEASKYVYSNGAGVNASVLNFIDEREDADMDFTSGVLSMNLEHQGAPLDPMTFLREYTIAELQARGIQVVAGTNDASTVKINTFLMRNYRSNGFAPFTVVTLLSADIESPEGDRRVVIFLKRGKVPVWSFQEIVEPALNQPLELLVQTLAAKINTVLYGQVVSDQTVAELVRKVEAGEDGDLAYQHVYQLGFSNNPAAIEPLIEFTKNEDEYIRLAAISALGTINAQPQTDYLISLFKSDAIWQDRAMAAKSLGDLGLMGNQQAMDFLKQNADGVLGESKQVGAAWAREIIDLYLAE